MPDLVTQHINTPEPPSISVTRQQHRSLLMFLLHHGLRPFKSKIVKSPAQYEPAGSPKLEAPPEAHAKCEITERDVGGIHVYDLRSKHAKPSQQSGPHKRVYYFAGGGWQSKASKEHWLFLAELAEKVPEVSISLVSYPLAPNSPASRALPEIAKLYYAVLKQAEVDGERVVLAGDSAGANIVLCTVINSLRNDPDARVPAAILAISPSTDLRRANPDMPSVEKHDPILCMDFVIATANAWRGEWEPTDPRISPLYADVTPLARRGVQVHGITGRYDILGLDGVLMREKLNQAFVKGEWLDWSKQMHVFPLLFHYKLPESITAIKWIMDVLRRT